MALFKKFDAVIVNCDNYRAISVLPTVRKIVERAAPIQLYNHLDSNGLLRVKQLGFRRKRSTSSALLQFNSVMICTEYGGRIGDGCCFSRLKESLRYVESSRPLAQAACLGSGRLSCSMVQIILNKSVSEDGDGWHSIDTPFSQYTLKLPFSRMTLLSIVQHPPLPNFN